ncbi:MAG: UDP-N-acetylglucosamine pyrophosphorylase [Candidatus Neomarinimicrobiota bacterium]|nr:MAG: UDP-N-acetylglucosamine pyrophosphorylase [Candidatus Neomarinimicrobiota bacterium]
MKRPLAVAILAAGKGTRMKSDLAKVLHPVGGKPMILHVVSTAQAVGAERVIAILGHQRERVLEVLVGTGAEAVIQDPQLGTGHAVQQVAPLLDEQKWDLLVLSGDVPLLRVSTLRNLLNRHRREGCGATLLTARLDDPQGYGRIRRDGAGHLEAIVEEKDCTPEDRSIREINAGIYLFQSEWLFKALRLVRNDNAQGEYYLPDVLPILRQWGREVALELLPDPIEIQGVNTPAQLKEINRIFRARYEETTS